MIPNNISKDHILKAIEYVKKNGVPNHRQSAWFFLKHDGENYPPKYVISIANKFANGEELSSLSFSGGNEANNFLQELEFEVTQESTSSNVNIWIEKTYYTNREHKQEGELALGKALISPQRDKGGADIYRNMRRAKEGDLILHLIDNKEIVGISKINEDYTKAPNFVYLREYENGEGQDPGYKITLRDFVRFENPISRDVILTEEFKEQLLEVLESFGNVFYNRNLTMRQGAYLTGVPESLMQIINSVYKKTNGNDIPYWRNTKMPEIALIGITDDDYIDGVKQALAENSKVASTWTYSISKEKNELLESQKNFNIYCYMSKKSGGRGLVEYRLKVEQFSYTEEEISCPFPEIKPLENHKGRGWYVIEKLEKVEPKRKLEDFVVFDTAEKIVPTKFYGLRNQNAEFFYVKDDGFAENSRYVEEVDSFKSTRTLLENKKQIIFYGPPGTGKTFNARNFAVDFLVRRDRKSN